MLAALLTIGPATVPNSTSGTYVASATAQPHAGDTSEIVTVRSEDPIVRVAEGDRARVRLTLGTGRPLGEPVTVRYGSGGGTASVRDHAEIEGTVTFPAGSVDGDTRTVTVTTTADGRPEVAETLPLRAESTTAGVRVADPIATVVIDAHGLPYLNERLPVAQRVQDLIERMTLEWTSSPYSAVDRAEDGQGNPIKMRAHEELISETLFVVSDYTAIQQLPGDYAQQVRASVHAGVDMFVELHSAP